MLLCSGPFWTVPGTQVRSPKTVRGTWTPVKSSLAWSLNSTRIVSSFAVCVALAPLYWLLICCGLWPVFSAFASSLASSRAVIGLPLAFLRSMA